MSDAAPGTTASAPGRTSWWPCDAAEHDRELNVEMGEEFGAEGPYLLRVLKDLAQAQRDAGVVRTGFRVLRQKTFIATPARVREIVEHAARIGALDDLVIDDDGRRFTCRVSGWQADQARGRAAIKKAGQRAADPTGHVPTTGDMSPLEGDVSGSVSPTRDNQRREDEEEEDAPATEIAPSGFAFKPAATHPRLDAVLSIFRAVPEGQVQIEDMAINAACCAKPGADVVAGAHLAASWALSGTMNEKHASRLLSWALDKIDEREAQKAGIRAAAEKTGIAGRGPARTAAGGAQDGASKYDIAAGLA